MKKLFIAIYAAVIIPLTGYADDATSFTIYAPSRVSQALLIADARVKDGKLTLKQTASVDLGFAGVSITQHLEKPILYVAAASGQEGLVPGASVLLNENGVPKKVVPFKLNHGCCYLSLDRKNNFVLGANYGDGFVDVYSLNKDGTLKNRVGGLDEGRKNAHCVLPSPDNRFVYIPYVKDSNDLYQYAFDETTGTLKQLDPKSAGPPESTGPRHMAYHPTLPTAYFSNEQGIGISVYSRSDNGQLKIEQVCEAVEASFDKTGLSASDIVITPDGRFLFSGIRGAKKNFDRIARYKILEDGKVELLGLTQADEVPWGLHLSPQGHYLIVTAFKGATLTVFKLGDNGELTKAASLDWDAKISDVVTR